MSKKFGLFNKLMRMINGQDKLIGKKSWSKTVWDSAWKYDDAFWKSVSFIDRKTDILISTLKQSRYLNWWYLSNIQYCTQKICEVMSKIVCRASLLKTDDYMYKVLTPSHRFCERCDLSELENIRHLIMQCPAYEESRIQMYKDLYGIGNNVRECIESSPAEVLSWLLGGRIEGVDEQDMIDFWCITGKYVCKIYHDAIAKRQRTTGDIL